MRLVMEIKRTFIIVGVLISTSARHGHGKVFGPYEGVVDRIADKYENDVAERRIETEDLGILNVCTTLISN